MPKAKASDSPKPAKDHPKKPDSSYPYDGEAIRKRRNERDWKQKKLAEELQKRIKAKGFHKAYPLSLISKIENATPHKALSLLELCELSRVLGVLLVDLLLPEYKEYDFDFAWYSNQEGEAQKSFEKLALLEKNGRQLIFSHFPSTVYQIAKKPTDYRQKRDEHLTDRQIACHEFYTLNSVLQFAFSLFVPYTLQEKIQILQALCTSFKNNHQRKLGFFNDSEMEEPDYANLEILDNGIIVMAMPSSTGYFLEIHHPKLCEALKNYYFQNPGSNLSFITGENAVTFLELLRNTLLAKEGLPGLLQKCWHFKRNRESWQGYAEMILQNIKDPEEAETLRQAMQAPLKTA